MNVMPAMHVNELMEAQFEERRHGWVDAIIHQWIEEHRDTFGIQRRVTDARAVEVAKMTEKLADTSKMDVPQVLLLKLDRLTDFMEHHYRLQASAFNERYGLDSSREGSNVKRPLGGSRASSYWSSATFYPISRTVP